MPRPRKRRRIRFSPEAKYYKPQGVPMRFLDEVEITHEEMEALRLKYEEELDQTKAAERMHISQPTYNRHLNSALEKVSVAIIKGNAIRIVDKK